MTKLAHVFPDVELAQGFNRLRAWADEFIAGISAVPDEHIVEIARGANEMETQGFRIRGACAAELKRRVRERSVGDEAKLGEAMAGLARDVGVHVQTLIDDCRIFEKFGDEIIVNNNLP